MTVNFWAAVFANALVIGWITWRHQRELNIHKRITSTILKHKLADVVERFKVAAEVNRWMVRGAIMSNEYYISFNSAEEVFECAERLGWKLDWDGEDFSPNGSLVAEEGFVLEEDSMEDGEVISTTSVGIVTSETKYDSDALRRIRFSSQIPYSFIKLLISTDEGEIE